VLRASVDQQGGGVRQAVTEISRNSIKNAVEVLANADPELNSMMVCTYPETFPTDGRIVKSHFKRLRQAIERRFGAFSYFAAVEYQQRGAPHLHIALSFNLRDLGPVVKLKRRKMSRRHPFFETVPELQNWAFRAWKDIISKPDPVYNGVKLDWVGLDGDDLASMDAAYHQHNAGFSWEVMREKNGASRYFVKELSGLKGYQKTIPDGFLNPGLHFLYSRDMKFDEEQAIDFLVTEAEIRELLNEIKWNYLPSPDKVLFKRLWNTAAELGIKLIERGYIPIGKNTLEAIKTFTDLRMDIFVDRTSNVYQQALQYKGFELIMTAIDHWNRVKRKIIADDAWNFTFSTGPLA
jgi:hypothetical protein